MKSSDGRTGTSQEDLLAAARLLLTPGSRGGISGAEEWVIARVRWHRADGNDELADQLLEDINGIRAVSFKEPLDA